MSCQWKQTSRTNGAWRTARSECYWYLVREEIERLLKLGKQYKSKTSTSCVVGYRYRPPGATTELIELIDQEWIADQQRLLVRIMPKRMTAPPRMRDLAPVVDADMTEDERLAAMQGTRYHVDRVGTEPPPNYVCKNCSCKGHYYKVCPWQRIDDPPAEEHWRWVDGKWRADE